MRIYCEDSDSSVDEVLLLLTASEAKEMISSLKSLIQKPEGNHHHIANEEYTKEVTLAIYDPEKIDPTFAERIKRLIREDT